MISQHLLCQRGKLKPSEGKELPVSTRAENRVPDLPPSHPLPARPPGQSLAQHCSAGTQDAAEGLGALKRQEGRLAERSWGGSRSRQDSRACRAFAQSAGSSSSWWPRSQKTQAPWGKTGWWELSQPSPSRQPQSSGLFTQAHSSAPLFILTLGPLPKIGDPCGQEHVPAPCLLYPSGELVNSQCQGPLWALPALGL